MKDLFRKRGGTALTAQPDWWSSSDRQVGESVAMGRVSTKTLIPYAAATRGEPWWGPPQSDTARKSGITASRVVLLLTGVLLIVGSVSPWISVSLFGNTVSVDGTDRAISNAITMNGWITVALGIVMILVGTLMMTSSQTVLQLLALSVSAMALAFTTYFVVRVVQELSRADAATARFSLVGRSVPVHEHIAWGLILLLVAAVVGVIGSGVDFRESARRL
ncbi:MAG TPA: hypothetical protein VFZ97_10850 [Acidimicrobiales bacterium]